jgi:hypothetical protein
MDHTPEMQDYTTFMEWFQNKYPELYMCCWKEIKVPVDGEGVTVNKDGLDDETYTAIIKATKEYYQNEHK